MSSFVNTLRRCHSTVRALRNSWTPISGFESHVDEVSPSYWRVTFANGPVNLLDPHTIDQLAALVDRIEGTRPVPATLATVRDPDGLLILLAPGSITRPGPG